VARNVIALVSPPRGSKIRTGVGFRKVRLASWNIGSLTDKSIELVESLHRCRINIA